MYFGLLFSLDRFFRPKIETEPLSRKGNMAKNTLWQQLNAVFPLVLEADASKAVNGTKLFDLVKPKLEGEFTENAIRAYFSYMSKDPTTTLAKKSDGQGYYLRSQQDQQQPPSALPSSPAVTAKALLGRDEQPEEKFRAVFMRNAELASLQFPMRIDHTTAKKKEAGVNQWKFPDVVILGWGVGKPSEEGSKLDPILLAVKSSLGEPPFSLQSVELKVALTLSTFRENFFQCLSNSKWAHRSVLAVAAKVDDQTLRDELERLGASYDVSIDSYGLSQEELMKLPNAKEIREMPIGDFEQNIASKITISRISAGKERTLLDWEAINDLQSLSLDFKNLFEWIAYCLGEKKAFSYEDFSKIMEIKRKL